jgi:hypothetical protein
MRTSREFFEKKGLRRAILASKTRGASIAYQQIPCSTEQGIFLHERGILSCEQGISAIVANLHLRFGAAIMPVPADAHREQEERS